MNSIISEIYKVRENLSPAIDRKNTNRYRVVSKENDGSKTAYYFSAPIYNNMTRKAVDMKFDTLENTVYYLASNANITFTEKVKIENSDGACYLSLENPPVSVDEREISYGKEKIYPTANGIAIKSDIKDQKLFKLLIEVSKPFTELRANNKYFALMKEKFRPFFTVSAIGTADQNGNIIAPARLNCQKISDRKYIITVIPCTHQGKYVLIEANMYEPKLFQDTTVESNNPKLNNAFGSIAFIGSTKEFGEQWLYSRPDLSKMPELMDRKISRAVLHIPMLNCSVVELVASKVASRFCSFGSNWSNKKPESAALPCPTVRHGYIDLDILPMIADSDGYLTHNEGFILKAKKKNAGFSVIATGDNYFAPQILEINYR